MKEQIQQLLEGLRDRIIFNLDAIRSRDPDFAERYDNFISIISRKYWPLILHSFLYTIVSFVSL